MLKNERDVIIRKLFGRHNLGAVPSGPLSDDVALNLMNRIKLRLAHLDKDLQDKKVVLSLYQPIYIYLDMLCCFNLSV